MRKRLTALLVAGAVIVGACGETTPAPTAATPPAGTATPTVTAPPEAQTITMVVDGDISGGLTNAADNVPTAEAAQFLYDGIYTYDASLTPVPNLSEALADVTEAGKVWTIKLKKDVKFHDGSDLTAEDVLQSYQIAQSANCRYNPSICLSGILDSVVAVDDYTVKFTLVAPNATMATVYLPGILIENKIAVDAAYDRYLAEVKATRGAALAKS